MRQDFWKKVERLKGRTLCTLRGNEFDITDVTSNRVIVVPRSTGKVRPIPASEITAASELFEDSARLTATQVRASGASEVNPVYVVAILKAVASTEATPSV